MWKGLITPACHKPLKKIDYVPSVVLPKKGPAVAGMRIVLKLCLSFRILHEDFVLKVLDKVQMTLLQKSAEQFDLAIPVPQVYWLQEENCSEHSNYSHAHTSLFAQSPISNLQSLLTHAPPKAAPTSKPSLKNY